MSSAMSAREHQYLFGKHRYCINFAQGGAALPQRISSELRSTGHDLIPLTVVHWASSIFEEADLDIVCKDFSKNDDVWSMAFASYFILVIEDDQECSSRIKHMYTVACSEYDGPEGPHVFSRATGQIWRLSLVVNDSHLAFVHGVLPGGPQEGHFSSVPAESGLFVPSRLYSRGDKRPLGGLRFAVKDTIAIKGIKTGFGSRCWRETYPTAVKTAPCIRVLLDAGATLVGIVKSTEFAEGLDPCEWLDTICPYNPRGDGQQKASSSSAGSAVAAAAYDWLDLTVGTDTGGSIRHPAGVQGLYGQRCSSVQTHLEGVLGATDLFNTVGIFARQVDIFCRAGSQLLSPLLPNCRPTKKRKINLLYPTRRAQLTNPDQHHGGQHRWFPNPDVDRNTWSQAEKLIDAAMVQLETALKCERIAFNINELWRVTPPMGQARSLDEAVGSIYSVITSSSAVHTFADKFFEDYAAAHGGKKPRVSSLVQRRLEYGRQISKQAFQEALESMQAFSQWAETMLFGSYDQEAMTLLVFPQSCGRPDYRDDIPDRGVLFNDTFSIYGFGYLMGCPDYTIPVGEIPFTSKVTGQEAFLPVSISLISKPGTDHELFNVVRSLSDAGVIRDVSPGPRMFPAEFCQSV